MSLQDLIGIALKASIVLTIFGVALSARPSDMAYLLRRPRLLFNSLLAMNIIMPVAAVLMVLMFDLHQAVEITLVALAVSPVPPLLPKKQIKAGSHSAYVIGLLTATALLSIIFVPVAIEFLGKVFDLGLDMPVISIIKIVLVTVLAPMAIGIGINSVAPSAAARLAGLVSKLASILLLAAGVPILFVTWPTFTALIGNGTLTAIVAFTLVGLAAGHLLGGPHAEDRTALALATASRHPGVAIAIARLNYPEQPAVLSVLVLAMIVGTLVAIPYLEWRKHAHGGTPHAAG